MNFLQILPSPKHCSLEAPSAALLTADQYYHPFLTHSSPFFIVFKPPKVTLKTKITLNDHLGARLFGDVAIGTAVTSVVSPFVSIIDKALVQRSAGSHTLLGSALESATSIVRDPVAYAKSPTFLWMWLTYACTYAAANSIKTLAEHHELQRAAERKSATSPAVAKGAVFVGTTFANTSSCLVKDRAYAKLFGSATATKVPKVSYGLWILRDFTVIGSSFILPEYVAPFVKDSFGLSDNTARHVAQVGTPMIAQVVAAPLHILGLDCFNRPLVELSRPSRYLERSRLLTQTYKGATIAKMIRVLPSYGIAGVWNTSLRNQWRNYLARQDAKQMLAATI